MGSKSRRKTKVREWERQRDTYEEEKPPTFEYDGFEAPKPEVYKGPLKQKHFDALAQIDTSPMPYLSTYELVMEEKNYLRMLDFLKINSRMYDSEVTDFFKDATIDRKDWHESGRLRKDLLSLSDHLKDCLIRVEVYGQERNDAFVAHALNGAYYEDPIQLMIPAFDYTKLECGNHVTRTYNESENL